MDILGKIILRRRAIVSVACALAVLACASAALAQNRLDLVALSHKVKPGVALIEVMEKGNRLGNGSGFVIDAKGIIATNYHVVEGAKELLVSFPADKDGKKFPVKGYLVYHIGKDMAIIKIDPGDKKLTVLPLAEKTPEQGEPVAAFGAPLGFSDTVTDGIVSSVRTGKELAGMMGEGYTKGLGYDLDANWLQTSAPISPGNSGGPLVNGKGEVVGINSFVSTMGQNLNFSLCIEHLRKLYDSADKNTVHELASLPKPREGRAHGGGMGDVAKTMELWKHVNRARLVLDAQIESCEAKLRQLPPPDPRNPLKGANVRNKKISMHFKNLGDAFKEYSSKISSMDSKEADPDLVGLVAADTVIAKQLSDLCKDVSNAAAGGSGPGAIDWDAAMSRIKSAPAELDSKRELVRLNLGRKYNKNFPTLEETAKEKDEPKEEKAGKDKSPDKADKPAPEKPRRDVMRVWTDSTGKFQIEAKLVGVEGGKAKLAKPDGTVIHVPIDKLSEADRKFIESSE
jgi:hypothetical protein